MLNYSLKLNESNRFWHLSEWIFTLKLGIQLRVAIDETFRVAQNVNILVGYVGLLNDRSVLELI